VPLKRPGHSARDGCTKTKHTCTCVLWTRTMDNLTICGYSPIRDFLPETRRGKFSANITVAQNCFVRHRCIAAASGFTRPECSPVRNCSAAPLWKINCPGGSECAYDSGCGAIHAFANRGHFEVRRRSQRARQQLKATPSESGMPTAKPATWQRCTSRKFQHSSRAPRPKSATLANGVSRWQEGAPGCDQFMKRRETR